MVTGSNQLISPSARWNKGNGVEGERTVSGLGGVGRGRRQRVGCKVERVRKGGGE